MPIFVYHSNSIQKVLIVREALLNKASMMSSPVVQFSATLVFKLWGLNVQETKSTLGYVSEPQRET